MSPDLRAVHHGADRRPTRSVFQPPFLQGRQLSMELNAPAQPPPGHASSSHLTVLGFAAALNNANSSDGAVQSMGAHRPLHGADAMPHALPVRRKHGK